jgi:hypothetical protein
MHISYGFDCGRCHEVAELMVELCRRPHLNFTVEIVLSDHRIRCDKLQAKNKAALVFGLAALRGKKWGNGKTSKTYPSKWTKSKAALIFPDLLDFKNVSADALDALGLLYDLGLETYSPR